MKSNTGLSFQPFQTLIAIGGVLAMTMSASAAEPASAPALLVVAHGSPQASWNERVIKLVEKINHPGPKDVAFLTGKPPEHALPVVAARLDQSGAKEIVVVPLLISSFSEHYEEVRYFAGKRADLPHAEDEHGEPAAAAQLKTTTPLRLTTAMDGHPLLTRILADQARPLVKNAMNESLVLIAHGPNEDSENERWLEHLSAHATKLKAELGLRRVEVATLRDDAPKEVRAAATEKFRVIVSKAGEDSRVLVLPVLVSVGHMQKEIRQRLTGLTFEMADGGVSNHPLLGEWIVQQAGGQSEARLLPRVSLKN